MINDYARIILKLIKLFLSHFVYNILCHFHCHFGVLHCNNLVNKMRYTRNFELKILLYCFFKSKKIKIYGDFHKTFKDCHNIKQLLNTFINLFHVLQMGRNKVNSPGENFLQNYSLTSSQWWYT